VARERQLSQTFVELADTLVADFDIVDFLHVLAIRCVELLDAAEGGLLLSDQRGGLRVMASSTERARLLELFELQNEQGPCLDCYRSGEAVMVTDLEEEVVRWPLFAPEALAAGFRSVVSLPMRCRSQVIGALNLFRLEPGPLGPDDMAAGQAMADVATIGILQQRAAKESMRLVEQLQSALNSRIVLEQAKGVLAERAQTSLDEAFKRMRSFARSNNRLLHDVALEVISGGVTAEDLGFAPVEHPG
jgi:GAF domain-containing protein